MAIRDLLYITKTGRPDTGVVITWKEQNSTWSAVEKGLVADPNINDFLFKVTQLDITTNQEDELNTGVWKVNDIDNPTTLVAV